MVSRLAVMGAATVPLPESRTAVGGSAFSLHSAGNSEEMSDKLLFLPFVVGCRSPWISRNPVTPMRDFP